MSSSSSCLPFAPFFFCANCALQILLARSALRYLLPSLARPGLSTEQAAAQPRNHLLVEYLSTGTYYNDHRCVGYCCCCFLSMLLLLLL
jgi:hypothetical protein